MVTTRVFLMKIIKRRQAINWTNYDLVFVHHIYASVGLDGLQPSFSWNVRYLHNFSLKPEREILLMKSAFVCIMGPRRLYEETNGLLQDCNNSCALAMELLQSCTEPWKLCSPTHKCNITPKMATITARAHKTDLFITPSSQSGLFEDRTNWHNSWEREMIEYWN